MMLEHLGEKDAADAILKAVEDLLAEGGPRTRDMGGNAGTVDVGKALAEAVAKGR
jgi:tartrate dehydrogenase/decarboxylase/D-malate dehydrogenase